VVKAKSRRAAKHRTGRRKRARAAKTPSAKKPSTKKVLVIDVGGTSVKILVTGQTERRSFPSGPTLTPRRMMSGVRKALPKGGRMTWSRSAIPVRCSIPYATEQGIFTAEQGIF
jgi:hypothetical protein